MLDRREKTQGFAPKMLRVFEGQPPPPRHGYAPFFFLSLILIQKFNPTSFNTDYSSTPLAPTAHRFESDFFV